MALNGGLHVSGQRINLLSDPTTKTAGLTIGAAVAATATTPVTRLSGAWYLVVQAIFLYGAGGTTANAYVQTSIDGGATWADIMNFSFTTAAATKISAIALSTALAAVVVPTDGSLASNTILSGLFGDRIRLKYVTTGTYTGATSLKVDAVIKQ